MNGCMDFAFVPSQRTRNKYYIEECKSRIRSKRRTMIYLAGVDLAQPSSMNGRVAGCFLDLRT
jgi:hypothetical protein